MPALKQRVKTVYGSIKPPVTSGGRKHNSPEPYRGKKIENSSKFLKGKNVK